MRLARARSVDALALLLARGAPACCSKTSSNMRLERRRRRGSRRARCSLAARRATSSAKRFSSALRPARSAARGSGAARAADRACAGARPRALSRYAVGSSLVECPPSAVGEQPRSASGPRRAPRARPRRASPCEDREHVVAVDAHAAACRRRRPCRRRCALAVWRSAGTLIAQPLLRQRNTVGALNTPAKFMPAVEVVASSSRRRRSTRAATRSSRLIFAAQAKPTACVICVPIGELIEPKCASRAVIVVRHLPALHRVVRVAEHVVDVASAAGSRGSSAAPNSR